MAEFLTFVVSGLAGGASYALLALGLVLVNRSSRILNFAQGEIGALATFVVASLVVDHEWGWPLAIGVGLAVGATTSGAAGAVLMRNPSGGRVPPLVGTVALLAFLVVVEAKWLGGNRSFPTPLGGNGITLAGVVLTPTRLLVLGSVAVVSVGLYLLLEHTRFGLALRAGADDREAATVIGLSPVRIEGTAWVIAGLLGALAGILLGWTNQSIAPAFLTLALIRGFAAAIVGGMRSLPGAAVGGLVVGVAESLTRRYWGGTPGASELVVFAIIFLTLAFRPEGLFTPRRTSVMPDETNPLVRVPPLVRPARSLVTTSRLLRAALVIAAVVAMSVLVAAPFSGSDAFRLASLPIFGLLALGLNSLLATSGQLSLGHVGLFGLGAFMAAVSATTWKLPFVASVLVGIAAAALAACILGVAARRVQGLYLAVLTLSFALVLERFLFPKPFFSQGGAGLFVARPALGPFDLADDTTFLALCLSVLLLALLVDRWVMGRPFGRGVVAVRDNVAAAAALGIPSPPFTVGSFVYSGALAGLAGALFAYRQGVVVASAFPATLSFSLLIWVVLGGVGSRVGAVLAVGVFTWSTTATGTGDSSEWLVLIGSAVVVLAIAQYPGGIASLVRRRPPTVDAEQTGPASSSPRSQLAARPAPPPPAIRMGDGRLARPVLLGARGITVQFGAVRALNAVDFDLLPGEVVGVVGPNGAGKTTLFHCLSGALRPDEGTIWFRGRVVDDLGPAARAALGLGRTFQQGGGFPSESVRTNLLLAQHLTVGNGSMIGGAPAARRTEPERADVADLALSILDLDDVAGVLVGDLPYGRRRLLELGCAIVAAPRVLLLDEPAAGMTLTETSELAGVVAALRLELGLAVVVIEHNVPFVRQVADRIIVLNFGEKVIEGTPDEVIEDPAVREAYLGVSAPLTPIPGEPT